MIYAPRSKFGLAAVGLLIFVMSTGCSWKITNTSFHADSRPEGIAQVDLQVPAFTFTGFFDPVVAAEKLVDLVGTLVTSFVGVPSLPVIAATVDG